MEHEKMPLFGKKSQRFCGILFMLSGIIILILCFLLEGTLLTVISLVLLVSAAIVGGIYSYLAAQKEDLIGATGTGQWLFYCPGGI